MKAALGYAKPKDSGWLYMDRYNPEKEDREPMGKLCVSVEVWPKEVAEQNPAGTGRNAPNQVCVCVR